MKQEQSLTTRRRWLKSFGLGAVITALNHQFQQTNAQQSQRYEELCESDMLEGLALASVQAERRLSNLIRVPILDYRPTNQASPDQLALPGTITVWCSRRLDVIEKIKQFSTNANGADHDLYRSLQKPLQSRRKIPLVAAFRKLKNVETVFDIFYGGKTVGWNVPLLREAETVGIVLPYNGGRVLPDGFTVMTRSLGIAKGEAFSVALRQSPQLTETEKKVLEALPAEFDGGNVAMCYALTGVAVTYVLATLALAARGGSMKHLPLSEELIGKLGPQASALRILQMRRDIVNERAGYQRV